MSPQTGSLHCDPCFKIPEDFAPARRRGQHTVVGHKMRTRIRDQRAQPRQELARCAGPCDNPALPAGPRGARERPRGCVSPASVMKCRFASILRYGVRLKYFSARCGTRGREPLIIGKSKTLEPQVTSTRRLESRMFRPSWRSWCSRRPARTSHADELGSVQGEEVELGLGELPAAAEDVESTALEVAGGEK